MRAGNERGGALRERRRAGRLDEVDSEQPGMLRVRCTGTQRFRLDGAAAQQADGLWVGRAALLPDDAGAAARTRSMLPTVQALANAIATLKAQGAEPFHQPHRLRRRRLGGQPLVRDPADLAGAPSRS